MARTINKVELLGRVGTEPEMQYTPGGTAVTKLRLATDPLPQGRRGRDGLARRDVLGEVGGGRQRVRGQGPAHLRRGPSGAELMGGRGRPAPPPHRTEGPRLRDRLPRRQQRQWRERGRRGGLPTSNPAASTTARRNHEGRFPPTWGGPASHRTPITPKEVDMTEIQDTEKVLLDALRLNANVLNEVALRYGIGPGADRSEDERPRDQLPLRRAKAARTGDGIPRTGATARALVGQPEQARRTESRLPRHGERVRRTGSRGVQARRDRGRPQRQSSFTTTRRATPRRAARTRWSRGGSPRPANSSTSNCSTTSSSGGTARRASRSSA